MNILPSIACHDSYCSNLHLYNKYCSYHSMNIFMFTGSCSVVLQKKNKKNLHDHNSFLDLNYRKHFGQRFICRTLSILENFIHPGQQFIICNKREPRCTVLQSCSGWPFHKHSMFSCPFLCCNDRLLVLIWVNINMFTNSR